MAFADAMNVNDGTITSSPGPTPAVASARCRPVVHDVVAIPCFAPTYTATAFSNSPTLGPWVPHPDLIDSYGARASSSPSDGLVIGTLSFFFASIAILHVHSRGSHCFSVRTRLRHSISRVTPASSVVVAS